MKKSPLVSVIIPMYNEERYIHACLLSLTTQTYKNIEIIVVDDGSTDNSIYIAKNFEVIIIKQKHKGPGAARNIGAKNAKGEILLFLDADMRYDLKHVEKLIEPIVKSGAVGSFSREEYVANPENIWSQCWSINSGLPITHRMAKNTPTELGVYRAIRKEDFLSAGGFDHTKGYFDDGTLEEKIGKKAVFANGAISYHYNPETLYEVYVSSRWIGRSGVFKKNIYNVLRFSVLNSVRVSIKKIVKGAPAKFLLFKSIYDFGMLTGVFFSRNNHK